jgi:SAM-dependent methyltransferase
MRDFLQKSLSNPEVYIGLQKLLGADRLRRLCIDQFAKVRPGERVLDIGCGPGYILDYLPEIDFVGFDTDPGYIEYASRKYAGRGKFHCDVFSEKHVEELGEFDVVLLFGILHHVDDAVAKNLMRLLARCSRPTGRVVTIDPCFVPDQTFIQRFIAKADRGKFVRTEAAYDRLASVYFGSIQAKVFHNTCRIPSTERLACLTEPIRPLR